MPKADLPDLPWMIDGRVDMKKVPLGHDFETAVGRDAELARNSIDVLGVASAYGRVEATVFLMGLLAYLPGDDWGMRIAIVESIRMTRTRRCAALLFSELRRVKSSNTTRRYLNTIIDALLHFPERLVREEFESLSRDKTFSAKMRHKFHLAAEEVAWRSSGY